VAADCVTATRREPAARMTARIERRLQIVMGPILPPPYAG
jgi:hypothetical protein